MEQTTSAQIRLQPLSRSSIFFYLFLAIALYAGIHYWPEITNLKSQFLEVEPLWLIIAVGSQIGTYAMTSGVYNTLLRRYNHIHNMAHPISRFDLFKMCIISVVLNQIVPSGSMSGNGFIFNELIHRKASTAKAFFTVVAEAQSFYITMLSILLAILGLYPLLYQTPMPALFQTIAFIGVGFFTILLIVVCAVSQQSTFKLLSKKLMRFPRAHRTLERIAAMLYQGHDQGQTQEQSPWNILTHNTSALWELMSYHVAEVLLDAFTVFALLRGLGLHVAYIVVFFGYFLTKVISSLPLSPGSLVVYEGAMTLFYTSLGIPAGAAILVTLLYRGLSFWLPIPVGLLLYKNITNRKMISLQRIRRS